MTWSRTMRLALLLIVNALSAARNPPSARSLLDSGSWTCPVIVLGGSSAHNYGSDDDNLRRALAGLCTVGGTIFSCDFEGTYKLQAGKTTNDRPVYYCADTTLWFWYDHRPTSHGWILSNKLNCAFGSTGCIQLLTGGFQGPSVPGRATPVNVRENGDSNPIYFWNAWYHDYGGSWTQAVSLTTKCGEPTPPGAPPLSLGRRSSTIVLDVSPGGAAF